MQEPHLGIRGKIISIVLPLLIVALLIGGLSATYIASNAVTRVAVEFLEFKTDELEKYVEGQWRILLENDLTGREDMVQAAQAGIEVFARSIVRSDTELIFALEPEEVERLVLFASLGDRSCSCCCSSAISPHRFAG